MLIQTVQVTGVEIVFALEHERDAIFFADFEFQRGNVVIHPLDDVVPLYACAPGKAMLAFQPPDRIKDVLDAPLAKFTDNTLTSKEAIQCELESIRRQGFAMNRGEVIPSIAAVATPILNSDGWAVAAVSSPGLNTEADIARLESLAFTLSTLSQSVSASIGFVPDSRNPSN
jgi:DNA-binding IclR family transcriptional regulator